MTEKREAPVLLRMLADAIDAHQCGDLWDVIGFTEEEHASLPELLRAAADRPALTCGACGQPWTGEGCGQKDNWHPYPVCYPWPAGGDT